LVTIEAGAEYFAEQVAADGHYIVPPIKIAAQFHGT